jgi:hypothetical protein
MVSGTLYLESLISGTSIPSKQACGGKAKKKALIMNAPGRVEHSKFAINCKPASPVGVPIGVALLHSRGDKIVKYLSMTCSK